MNSPDINLSHQTLAILFHWRIKMPSRYPLNPMKMNNTILTCVAATAGTSIGQEKINRRLSSSIIYLEFYST